MKVLASFPLALFAAALVLVVPGAGVAQPSSHFMSPHISSDFAQAISHYRLNEKVLKGLYAFRLDAVKHPCGAVAKAGLQAKFHSTSLDDLIAQYKASVAIQAELEKTGLTARDAVVGQMAMGLAYKHIKMAKLGMSDKAGTGNQSEAMKANIALLKAHWPEVEANVKKRMKARMEGREKRGGKMPACYRSMMMKMSMHNQN